MAKSAADWTREAFCCPVYLFLAAHYLAIRTKFFASAAARDEYIHQLKETAHRQDPVLPTIPPHQLIRWQQAMAIAPEADPVEVIKFWKSEQLKIAKLGNRYLQRSLKRY